MSYLLDHVALGVRDMADCVPALEGLLGGRPYEGGPSPAFHWAQWRFAEGGRLELISPRGADGFLHRFLDRQGAGVHHVTFKVPSLQDAAERARGQGYDITGYDASNPGWKECFLHPKQAQGVVIQLAETGDDGDGELEPPEGGATYGGWSFPAPSASRPEPARVIGLRTAVRDEAAARKQWEHTLGGVGEPEGEGLRFRWPDSPLSIHVVFESGSVPGPRGIEVQARQGLVLPDAAVEALGARLIGQP